MEYNDAFSDVDCTKVQQFLRNDPVYTALNRIDTALGDAEVSVNMEIAEDTYGWLQAVDTDELSEYPVRTATFYVDKELDDLQETVPDSDFSALTYDTGNDAYDLIYPALTLHFKFGEQHKSVIPIENKFENINTAAPTINAYLEQGIREE